MTPFFCAAIVVASLPCFRALALWLIFSTFCLRTYEDGIYRRERTQELDISGGLIESQIQGDTVGHFSEPTGPGQNSPAEPDVPTGMGADINHKVRTQKTKL